MVQENSTKRVLNKGYVGLLETMGGDKSVVRNARRCWRSEERSNPKADRNLIKHLLTKGHMTPFESIVFTFDVKAPIFVTRQWMRHRIGSFNEESLRYCVAEPDFFVPEELPSGAKQGWTSDNIRQYETYKSWAQAGVSKEQARAFLPLGTYTKFYWTVNGSSLMNFLRLRLDRGAQKEIREYAKAILELAKEVAPISFELFEEEVLNEYQ